MNLVSTKSSFILLLLVLSFVVVADAEEITSLGSKVNPNSLTIELGLDKVIPVEPEIDFTEWKVFFALPHYSSLLPPNELVQRFPEQYRDYVDSFYLEQTETGSRLVLVLGKKATPLKITASPVGNTVLVNIPTVNETEESDLVEIQLGFMDPPLSFLEISPAGKVYKVNPIPASSEVKVSSQEGKVEVKAELPPVASTGIDSFLIPTRILEKSESETAEGSSIEQPEGESGKTPSRKSFKILAITTERVARKYEDFFLKKARDEGAEGAIADAKAEGSSAIDSQPQTESAKAEDSSKSTQSTKRRSWEVKGSTKPTPQSQPAPSSEPAPTPKPASTTEPAASGEPTPVEEALKKVHLEGIEEPMPAELVISESAGDTPVSEISSEETKAGESLQSSLAEEGIEAEKSGVDSRPRWIPESVRRKESGEVKASEGEFSHIFTNPPPAPPPPPMVDGRPWDVKRRPGKLVSPLELPLSPEEELLESERITFETTEAPLKEAIALLVSATPFNVIVDDSVGSMLITVSFRDTPLRDALNAIASAKGIMYRLVGKTIIVGQREDIGRRLGGFETRSFNLEYADATDVMNILIKNGIVSENNISVYYGEKKTSEYYDRSTALTEGEGGISAGDIRRLTGFLSTARANVLIVTETPEKLEQISRIIRDLDKKPKVVTLETTVVEISESGLKRLGFEIEDEIKTHILEEQGLTRPQDPNEPGARWLPLGTPGYIALGLWFQDFFRSPIDVLLTLKTVIESGEAQILSRPNISTVDGSQAIYFAGTLLPYITRPAVETPTTFTPPRVAFQPVGVTLSFKPRIDKDGYITMDVNPVVSTLVEFVDVGSGTQAPMTQSRQVMTTIRVKNQETFVIAGMLNEKERETLRKVPLLGQVPLFEKLFTSRSKDRERTEIMVFVTPVIRED